MLRISSLLLSFCCLASTAQAAVIFGDSAVDQGCVYSASYDTFPPAPYYDGRYADGPIWVDYAFNGEQTSYACGGATSGRANLLMPEFPILFNTGLLAQVKSYLNTNPLDIGTESFYIDLGIDEVWAILSDDSLDLIQKATALDGMVAHIQLAANLLQNAGATDITVINVPEFNLLPVSTEDDAPAILSLRFNKKLAEMAFTQGLSYFNINTAFLLPILYNPEDFGFTDVTDACYDVTAEVQTADCVPSTYLFWDNLHFTSQAQAWLAEAILAQ